MFDRGMIMRGMGRKEYVFFFLFFLGFVICVFDEMVIGVKRLYSG